MRAHEDESGFTLMELLIVVAIIGIIAAIAIPNLLVAIQRAKQRRTMADMKSIALAWEARATELGKYNAAGGPDGADVELPGDQLALYLSPTYIKTFPTADAWQKPFAFFADQPMSPTVVGARYYAIISGGHDQAISSEFFAGPFTNYDCDIVYANGAFVSYPNGITVK
jgi:general secretion pathway protein G